jgi:hypothetical protein
MTAPTAVTERALPAAATCRYFPIVRGETLDPEFQLQFVGDAFLAPRHILDRQGSLANQVFQSASTSSARTAGILCYANR